MEFSVRGRGRNTRERTCRMRSWESGREKPRVEEREHVNAACRPARSIRTCLRCSCQKDSEQKIDLGQLQSVSGSVLGRIPLNCPFLGFQGLVGAGSWVPLALATVSHGAALALPGAGGCPSHLFWAVQACCPLCSVDISRRPSCPSSSPCYTFVPCVPELILPSTRDVLSLWKSCLPFKGQIFPESLLSSQTGTPLD